MHEIAQLVWDFLHPLISASSQIAGWFAPATDHSAFAIAATALTAGIMVTASGLLLALARIRFELSQENLRGEMARTRADLFFRNALLVAGWDGVSIMGRDLEKPLALGRGNELLRAGLAGPDAATLAKCVDALILEGKGFEARVRTGHGRVTAFRGRPVGRHAALFVRIESEPADGELDYRALVDAVCVPVWVRNRKLHLEWANRAFLDATGEATLDDAISSDRTIERSELDLATSVLDNREPASARRFVSANGTRRSFDIRLSELEDGSVGGVAVDVTEFTRSESQFRAELEAAAGVMNQLSTAIAIFGPDQRLRSANRAFSQRFGLDRKWLAANPTMNELLDALRGTGRIPEQREFGNWKRHLIGLFANRDGETTEVWHMPNGRSEKMRSCPHLLGGLALVFDDITEQLEIRSSYNALVKVQKATLDTFDEAIAVFGLDGRLKLHNASFAQLWRLEERELVEEPHVTALAEICGSRIGTDESWRIVIAGVNAAQPEEYNAWSTVTRADGKVVTLSLTRLPDGATMVTFSDVTDYLRFESMLREGARSAA